MAYEIPDFEIGVFPADVDMSNEQAWLFTGVSVYTALNTQGAGFGGAAVVPPSATSSPAIGVLQNNPQLGEAAQVMTSGVSQALMSGAGSIGNLLQCLGNGKFAVATSGTYAIAVALEQFVDGDISTILLQRNGKQ